MTAGMETVKAQYGLRMTVGELIAGIALLVTCFVALNGWIVLPTQIHHLSLENGKQDARIAAIEKTAAERAETLVRIDERTKRIEESLKAKLAETSP